MGRKGGQNKIRNSKPGSHTPISLREEANGKFQTKAASNFKSISMFEHLKKLAVFATDVALPSLDVFYGQHLATVGEAMGVSPDPSLLTCQRCETVLQPGFNSTVRIEKKRSKVMHRDKKFVSITQNNVVYRCHFCLHQNLKRGTPKGYIKGVCPSKNKSILVSTQPIKPIKHMSSKLEKGIISKDEANEMDVFASSDVAKDIAPVDGSVTPSSVSITTLLEGKKRRRHSSTSKEAIENASMSPKVEVAKTMSMTSRRRRKSWTSLKEISQSKKHENSQVANLTIPFSL